jgi:hypothetical protein
LSIPGSPRYRVRSKDKKLYEVYDTWMPEATVLVASTSIGLDKALAVAQAAAKIMNDEPAPASDSTIKGITDQRSSNYGTPADNHGLTAVLWDAWYKERSQRVHRRGQFSKNTMPASSVPFTAEDVCVFNILQKLSRLANGHHEDSVVDIAGYASNIQQLREEQRNPGTKT